MPHCSQTCQEATQLMTPLRPRATQKKSPKLLSQKKPTLLGTWNVRTLRETGRCAQAVREINQYHLTLLGMCEVRWNSYGETRLQTGQIVLYSGKDRMKKSIDQKLRDEQARFRKERSCTDQIATLTVIVEQTMEWQMPLYVCFIDFEKAFDSVDRQAIWDILCHYGVPDKIISVTRRLHEGFACQVIHSGRLSEDFSTGVRQGCGAGLGDATAYASSGKGIQWTFLSRLEDLEFTDDLALLSCHLQDLQDKVNALSKTAQRVGLRISQDKTKLLRTNNQQEAPVTIEGAAVEDVSESVYLGSKMSTTGGTDEDIKARIKKAQQAFTIL